MQNLIAAARISLAMGILLFFQNLGAAIWLVIAQLIFTTTLRSGIPRYAPGVDADVVIAAGASSIRKVVSGDMLEGVLKAYSKSVDRVMYLGVGISVAAFVCGWGMGWKDVRAKKKVEEGGEGEQTEVASVA